MSLGYFIHKCLHLKRTNNDIYEGHLSGMIGTIRSFPEAISMTLVIVWMYRPDPTQEMAFMYHS